jgi:hypothetical protein
MSRRALTLSLLALLLIAGGTSLFLYLFKRETREITLPPKGEAAYNPLYALKQALLAQGIQARSYPSLNPTALELGRDDTLVLYTQPEAISPAQSERLLGWVEKGGHLVMPGPSLGEDPGPLANSLELRATPYPKSNDAEQDGEDDEDIDYYAHCTQIATGGAQVEVEKAGKKRMQDPVPLYLCDPRFTSKRADFVMHDGSDKLGYRFGRLNLGQGVVTVTPTDFLENSHLDEPIPAQVAYQILAPRLGRGRVHLVYSADVPSLWRLMLEEGWQVLLPALLALIAWLLMRGQRFGALVPAASQDRRALLEHVQAAGELAFRRGRMLALHRAVLDLFRKRLARREPLIAAMDGDLLVQTLATRLDLDPARIRLALSPVGLQRPDAFLQCISTLLLMRNRL